MAQSGYTPILIYGSGTASNVPLAANLTSSSAGVELALNYADGLLYYKNSSGVVTKLASRYYVDQNGTAVWLTSVSGTNTIVGTATPTPAAYVAGQSFRFIAAATNTGAVTINVSSLGAKAITKNGTTPLDAGDIQSGAVVTVTYDGTEFQLSTSAGSSNSGASGAMLVNKTEVITSYTLPAGSNAISVGPITIDAGATVTITSGQRWVIV